MKDWLDGRKLARWIRRHMGERTMKSVLTDSQVRRVNEWASGQKASFYALDPILVALGMNETDIPNDLWADAPNRGGAPNSRPGLPERAVELRKQGFTLNEIAELLDVNRRTVSRWTPGIVPIKLLTPEQRAEIAQRYVPGVAGCVKSGNCAQLAEEFGISKRSVSRIAQSVRLQEEKAA